MPRLDARRRLVCAAAVFVACVSCGGSPTAPWYASTPPSTSGNLLNLVLAPRAVDAGQGTQGTVTLNAPPTAAATIALSSTDPSASVPASVVIAPGATTATFPIETRPIGVDAAPTITASLGGQRLNATLAVFRIAPNSFWYDSDAGDAIGLGSSAHYSDNGFSAICDSSFVYIQFNGAGFWDAIVGAPRGAPLQTGSYEDAHSEGDTTHPTLLVAGNGSGCESTGRFVVETADLSSNGTVAHFVVNFEERCLNSSAILRGEFRLTNPSLGPGGASPPRCLR